MGQRRGRKFYKRFYAEELHDLQLKPRQEYVAFLRQFTPQEISILNYIAQGNVNKQIALELGISESTVKTHVSAILSKMNASDRTEAVVIAIKQGLIIIT